METPTNLRDRILFLRQQREIEIDDKGSRSRTPGPISLFSDLMEKE
jgi:hypothetical protein